VSLAAFVVLVGVCAIAFGVGGVFVTRRLAARTGYVPQHDDLLGASFSVAGTAFTVLLAFVVFLSWEHYAGTRAHLEDEADAIGNLYRLTDGQPAAEQEELRRELVCYARSVIDDEFPAMAEGEASLRTERSIDRLFQTYSTLPVSGERESGIYQTVLPLLDGVDDARHDRLLEAEPLIPTFAWVLIFLTGAVTIAGTFLFYAERLWIQLAMTLSVTIVACGLIFLIFYFDDPFAEGHGLEPKAMQTAFPPGVALDRRDCPG
jgi:hypothetical protein